MICYKDMTFCTYLDCTNTKCHRRLTGKVLEDARIWWKDFKIEGGPPICQFSEKPECYTQENSIKNKTDGIYC